MEPAKTTKSVKGTFINDVIPICVTSFIAEFRPVSRTTQRVEFDGFNGFDEIVKPII